MKEASRSPAKPPAKPSKWEASFAWHWRLLRGPELAQQTRCVPNRQFRFDFAHLESKVAVELNGGTMSRGRHVRGLAIEDEYEKHNAAQRAGWIVLTFGTKRMQRDMAGIVDEVRAAIEERLS